MDILDTVVFSSGEIVNYIYSDKVKLILLILGKNGQKLERQGKTQIVVC